MSTVPTQCRGQRTANLEMATIGDASTGNALRRKEPPQRFEKGAFSKTPGCLSRCTSMCSTYGQPMILRRTFETSQRSASPQYESNKLGGGYLSWSKLGGVNFSWSKLGGGFKVNKAYVGGLILTRSQICELFKRTRESLGTCKLMGGFYARENAIS